MHLSHKEIKTPFGPLKLITNNEALKAILWPHEYSKVRDIESLLDLTHPILAEAERQMGLYFAGQLTFFNLPMAPVGTEFQKQVWSAVGQIPYGQKKTYAEIAEMIGKPNAHRAVGAANAKNPLALLTPCHRVVGSNGSLPGFSGTISIKKVLLSLEAEVHSRTQALAKSFGDRNGLGHEVHTKSDIVHDDRMAASHQVVTIRE